MRRRRSPKSTRALREARTLVEALDDAEAKELLGRLLDVHPELLKEAAGIAEEKLGAVTLEAVAHDVTFALEGLSVEDIWEQAGTHAEGSYVEPSEAAWEVVEEVVAPFLTDLTRRVALARRTEAAAICQDVLLALYRICEGDGEFLEGHAPDTLEETAAQALAAWKKGRRAEYSRAGRPASTRRCGASCRVPCPNGAPTCAGCSVGLPFGAAGDARGGSSELPLSSERRIHPDVASWSPPWAARPSRSRHEGERSARHPERRHRDRAPLAPGLGDGARRGDLAVLLFVVGRREGRWFGGGLRGQPS